MNIEGLDAVLDLARCHTKKPRGFGLYPARFFQCRDHTLSLIELRVIPVVPLPAWIAATVSVYDRWATTVAIAIAVDNRWAAHTG